MDTNKRVLLFGAGGFVGSYLAKEFCDHGYEVFGTDIAQLTAAQQYLSRYDVMDMLDAD